MHPLSPEDINDILRLLDSSAYDELHVETERFTLTLRRNVDGRWTQESRVLSKPHILASAEPGTAATAALDVTAIDPATVDREGLLEIVAPLPGVFYRAPKPGAPPFVEIGDRVVPETVVAIIETMKLMNSVNAGVSGTVTAICIGNGELAEQGAVLMQVRRDSPV